MKTRQLVLSITITLAVAAGVAAWAHKGVGAFEPAVAVSHAASATPAPSPFPDITIPGVPDTGQCCLWQLEKRIDGERRASLDPPYGCDTGVTGRGGMKISLKIASAGLPCDQSDLIPDGSRLDASGSLIRRADGFAHYIADFSITDPGGTVLFQGTLETIDRLGSHHLFFNSEPCNPQSHLEGWLVGRGTSALPNHTLRALLVARGTVPSFTTPLTPMTGSLNGVLIKCP
jgi:hypothetical protein